MSRFRQVKFLGLAAAMLTAMLFCDLSVKRVQAQTGPLTYPEINTALQTKLPNRSFQNKTQLIAFIITQVKRRKVDKPLTKDREDDLRQAGATDELIQIIRANSPGGPVATPTPDSPVDVGNLAVRAINLIQPEYTDEAKKARTTGEVKLALEIDENGKVVSVTRLTVLANGLTERAIEAARQSTFRPAARNGKPARGMGTITYNFKMNLVDVATTLANADALRERMDCDGAIAEYTRVIDLDRNNARARIGRGLCYGFKKSYQLAEDDLAAVTIYDKQNSEAFYYLAISQDFAGQPVKAAENYQKALSLRPQFSRQNTFNCLYIDRGQMTTEQARSAADGIIKACNQALRDASGQLASLIYYKRGIGYRLKADFDKAISDFQDARRSNPQFTAVNMQLQIAFNGRGLESYNKKDYRKAFDDISEAIRADPQSPTPYINRCVIYLYAWKQYTEAITDCSSAIKLATKSSMAYTHRGYAYELSNSRNEAITDYKKALELDPQNQTARNYLNRLQPERPSMRN